MKLSKEELKKRIEELLEQQNEIKTLLEMGIGNAERMMLSKLDGITAAAILATWNENDEEFMKTTERVMSLAVQMILDRVMKPYALAFDIKPEAALQAIKTHLLQLVKDFESMMMVARMRGDN